MPKGLIYKIASLVLSDLICIRSSSISQDYKIIDFLLLDLKKKILLTALK